MLQLDQDHWAFELHLKIQTLSIYTLSGAARTPYCAIQQWRRCLSKQSFIWLQESTRRILLLVSQSLSPPAGYSLFSHLTAVCSYANWCPTFVGLSRGWNCTQRTRRAEPVRIEHPYIKHSSPFLCSCVATYLVATPLFHWLPRAVHRFLAASFR